MKRKKKSNKKAVGNVMNPQQLVYDPNMLHNVVGQNKYDIAPYRKYGKSRNVKGRSKT